MERKMSGRKIILVIDDEKEIPELIKLYLSDLNVEIYSAYDGVEGVKLYKELMMKKKKPDLVVMDLNLSG
ncbi:MAG TPA: response regulator, partial [Thermoplasmata archaeon]|nr:response regulator [Thermoplasmata archaeon]